MKLEILNKLFQNLYSDIADCRMRFPRGKRLSPICSASDRYSITHFTKSGILTSKLCFFMLVFLGRVNKKALVL